MYLHPLSSFLSILCPILLLVSIVQTSALLIDQVAVLAVQYNGTACPTEGSISFSINGNITTITYAPENFPTIPKGGPSSSRTACTISAKLSHPGLRGYIDRTEYEGGLNVGDGVALTMKSTYSAKGFTTQTSSQIDIRGPKQGAFKANDDNTSDKEMWLPCNETDLAIATQSRFTVGSQKDTFESRFTAPIVQQIHIIWYPFDVHWKGCSSLNP